MISDMQPVLEIRGLRFVRPEGFSIEIPEFTLLEGEQVLLAGPSGLREEHAAPAGRRPPGCRLGRDPPRREDRWPTARGGRRDAIRADRVGMVFQTHHLLPGFTARENVSAPLLFRWRSNPAEHAAIADALLGSAWGSPTPPVRVDRLSVGQQQRVAIARALVGNPSVVLADEPTAALDPENAVTAVELLKDVCRECNAALLLTSHDPGLEGAFSRVVRFAELAQTSEVVG